MKGRETEAAETGDAAALMRRDDVNSLGGAARKRTRRITGDRVYYGSLTPPGEVTRDGYAEVRLSERDAVETDAVNVFVGGSDDGFEDYRDVGAPVDMAVTYGDGEDAFAERLDEVDGVSGDVRVRAVALVPDGRTTAYTDLKAVAATRLCLDVIGVRIAREKVGEKLAQTSLAYGANDLGFVREDDDFDPELAAREAGFTPVERADSGGYDV